MFRAALSRTVPSVRAAVTGSRAACATAVTHGSRCYSSRPLPGDDQLQIPKIFKDHTERTLYPEIPSEVPVEGVHFYKNTTDTMNDSIEIYMEIVWL